MLTKKMYTLAFSLLLKKLMPLTSKPPRNILENSPVPHRKQPYFKLVSEQSTLIIPVKFSKTWDFYRLKRLFAGTKIQLTYSYKGGKCHASI